MDKLENQIQELFGKTDWTNEEWALFFDLLEKQSPQAMQYTFQENFISKLREDDSRRSIKARQLLDQIHARAGLHKQPGISQEEVPLRRMADRDDNKVRRLMKRVAVAASIILMVGVGSYFIFFNKTGKQTEIAKTQEQRFKNDVEAPKVIKAMITLADGRTVVLDSVTSGMLATQGDVNILKNSSGEIVYSSASAVSQEIQYNTMFNPRGSKVVNLTLQDGTKVWLNSESSIKYPVAFSGNERKVEITGEAYFEASPSPSEGGGKRPFIVQRGDMQITVLGTHFNVNAYDDEADIKVTLLEGSVKVASTASRNDVVIRPGEQAVAMGNGPSATLRVTKDVDIEQVMAWKNGRFELNGNVQGIMKQIARWYDVDIEYMGNVTDKRFGGTLSREENVSGVLKYLELTGSIHFRIEGKKVIAMP